MTNSDLKAVHSKDNEFLSVRQLTEFLGVSEDTVYSWTMRKAIPHFKLGKMLRFHKAEIIRWMEAKRVEPSA